jgi:hypothetical protein
LDIFSDGLVGDICYGHRAAPPSRLVEVPSGCGFAGRVRGQAPASALNRLFSTATETDPTRTDPPQGEATPEIESVDLEEILI